MLFRKQKDSFNSDLPAAWHSEKVKENKEKFHSKQFDLFWDLNETMITQSHEKRKHWLSLHHISILLVTVALTSYLFRPESRNPLAKGFRSIFSLVICRKGESSMGIRTFVTVCNYFRLTRMWRRTSSRQHVRTVFAVNCSEIRSHNSSFVLFPFGCERHHWLPPCVWEQPVGFQREWEEQIATFLRNSQEQMMTAGCQVFCCFSVILDKNSKQMRRLVLFLLSECRW